MLEREAGRFVGADPPADMEPIKQFAIGRCMDMIRNTLIKFDVTFDVWQSERALHDSGEVSSTLAALEQAGKAGDLAIISARTAELDAQFAALQEAMKHETHGA